MGDYLIVARPDGDPIAEALSAELRGLARHNGLRIDDLNSLTWIATGGPHPPKIGSLGRWVLVGDVFDRRSPHLPACLDAEPWSFERKMLARIWGRFIGVSFAPDRTIEALLRDPAGALECVTWTQEGLTFVTGSVADWLFDRLSPPWRIDMDRLARTLRDPVAATGPLLLVGPVALEPGMVQTFPTTTTATVLWTPAGIAIQSLGPEPGLAEAAAHLRGAVDETVSALAHLSSPIAAEVSGGLDSSILASSLVSQAPGAVGLWINAVGSTPEADERVYVEALSRKLGISPVSVPHATGLMTEGSLTRLSQGFRPGMNALDQAHDEDWTRRFKAAGVKAVMTGKGGDSILLQRITADVFVDRWHKDGWASLFARDAAELAAANEVSLWSMASFARRHKRMGHRWPQRTDPLLPPLPGPETMHPWLTGCAPFGPAKAMQIAGVADSVSRFGPSPIGLAVDVLHPLCSQPVIEACLSLPVSTLTTGGRDRGLARRAFSDRLPAEIVERRSKGDMTRIYGRMILDNLEVLRPWLLEGRLAALGVIDRAEAERQLARDTLIWRGKYSNLMVAAAYEGWVRAWEARLAPAA